MFYSKKQLIFIQKMRRFIISRDKKRMLANTKQTLKDSDCDRWKKKISQHEELIRDII